MTDPTRNEERVLLLVERGEPWAGAEDRKLRAGRLTTLKRLARKGLVDPFDWSLTVEGRAYAVAVRLEGDEAARDSVECPDCGHGRIRRHDRCDNCGLSWEDLEVGGGFFDRVVGRA